MPRFGRARARVEKGGMPEGGGAAGVGGRWAVGLVALLVMTGIAGPAAARALVLVTAADNPPLKLSRQEVRRAYMGRVLEKGEYRLLPFRNASDPFLQKVFLQKVVYMAPRHYQRLVVLRAQRGGWHPPAIRRAKDLPRVLEGPEYRIAYMWESQARANDKVRVLQELWRE